MSDTVEATVDTKDPTIVRPWHGADNPLVALHEWMISELAEVSGTEKITTLEARVAALETENTKLKTQAEKAAHDLIDVKETVAAQADAGPVADAPVTSAYMPPGNAV